MQEISFSGTTGRDQWNAFTYKRGDYVNHELVDLPFIEKRRNDASATHHPDVFSLLLPFVFLPAAEMVIGSARSPKGAITRDPLAGAQILTPGEPGAGQTAAGKRVKKKLVSCSSPSTPTAKTSSSCDPGATAALPKILTLTDPHGSGALGVRKERGMRR